MSDRPIRVLVVDDSVFMRAMLKDALSRAEGIEVMGSAQNGTEGLAKILTQKPDVVTLDIEMPGMTGLEVLERVMKESPTAIVVVSTKTQAGAKMTIEALALGAVDYVAKPLGGKNVRLESFRESVVNAVKAAATSNRCSLGRLSRPAPAPVVEADIPLDVVVAIGISAGGPQTLHQLMPALPASFPPVVITQHMPGDFTGPFAKRLNQECKLEVREAANGMQLYPGIALIAQGDHHMHITSRGSKLVVELSDGPKVSGFRPSVDAMFDSLARTCAERTVSIVMTGMGLDGAAGTKQLKEKGGYTLAQDQATSVVYGMPKAAFETGCVERVVPLSEIPHAIASGARSLMAFRK